MMTTAVVKPGANPILVYSVGANWKPRQDPSKRFDGLGLSYSRLSDPATTNAADFVRLEDGGTGELLTVDMAGAEVAPDMLPVFDVLKCASGTTLDVNGNDFVQGELVGFPTLANVEYLKSSLDRCGLPWIYIAGNHDWHFENLPETDGDRRAE